MNSPYTIKCISRESTETLTSEDYKEARELFYRCARMLHMDIHEGKINKGGKIILYKGRRIIEEVKITNTGSLFRSLSTSVRKWLAKHF